MFMQPLLYILLRNFSPKGDDTVKLLLFCPSFFNAPIGEWIMGIYAYC